MSVFYGIVCIWCALITTVILFSSSFGWGGAAIGWCVGTTVARGFHAIIRRY